MNSLTIRDILITKRIRTFSARELSGLLSLSKRQTIYYLNKGVRDGLFSRVKRNLYYLKTDPPSELEIANQLYRPSYVSFEYALAYYNLLPEIVYTITSATTKSTRQFSTDTKTFQYTTIKIKAFTGYKLMVEDSRRFLIADPEKALVDYLYTVSLGRRALYERIDLSKVKKDNVRHYASLFSSKSLDLLIDKLFVHA
jgi:predicted transcriptional regulator of viral defense system